MILPGFEISTDRERLDAADVHGLLADTYWASGRTVSVVERMICNSVCFGGFLNGELVAFGRLITDSSVFAFMADMVVAPAYRGRGYGAAMAREILAYADGCGVSVMLLNTRDARGFYEKLGFRALPSADRMMWRSVSKAGLDAV